MSWVQSIEKIVRPIMFALICGLFTATFTVLLVIFGSHNVKSVALLALFIGAIGQFVSQETEQAGPDAHTSYKVALMATRASMLLYLVALFLFMFRL